ncbi:DUF4198 domain-containing protein [Sphingomonas sp.]|uniref:DUF4198 domain-containing protein n=1 Tax=Sphingomonas sp. TaxID=28214 RepID=UPI0018489090|nr:DUF4198 domain-containing protein [Sphingomonas sp.]MBA3510369.1 DUF4198 domain-containing protein [Sphingomonas sp.]
MKLFRFAALCLALTGVANAHDSWLEPKSFRAQPNSRVPVTFYVGHHGEQRSASLSPRPRWLLSMRSDGPAGTTDLVKTKGFNPALGVRLAAPGFHLLSLSTSDFRNDMGPQEFAEYVQEEGLAAAEAASKRRPIRSRKVRESYRRYAKTLIRVGSTNAGQTALTRRLGQRLEIVPGANPYLLPAGSRLPATIWYRGRPLAGALVALISLDRPKDEPATARSSANGRVSFALPGPGRWLLNVVWSEPSSVRGIDFQTSFSSLTFAVPRAR